MGFTDKLQFQDFTAMMTYFVQTNLPRWHLLVQSQQWKHQNNAWNLFKSGVFIINFEQISHIPLVFPLLNLNK